MENCVYHGKTICTFDLKDNNGYYYEDLVIEWKQAAAERLLTCTECGANVYLAAGPLKEPYFAHYDLKDCDYGNGHETEELKKGKRLLYQLLRRSFPMADIQARFRMDNGLYSTLYCIIDNGKSFAIDYRLQNNSLEKFRERDTFYQANMIKPIYVLGKKLDKNTKQIDWYQSLLQNSMGYLFFLDTEHESVTLKKRFSYRIGSERKFNYCIQTYSIKDIKFDEDAGMICGFSKECSYIDKLIQEEKLQYHKRQAQLKALREEQLRLEEKHLQQQEAYRKLKEQEVKVYQDTNHSKEKDEQYTNDDGNESNKTMEIQSLNPVIMEKCRKMIQEGNAHLVSKKYYDAIMSKLS